MPSGRETLYQYFQTGDKPTAGQFADLINSVFNLSDDQITIAMVQGLAQILASKAPATSVISREYANIAARNAETDFTSMKFAFVTDASADPNATAPYALYYRHNNFWYLIPGSAASAPDNAFTYTLPFTL